MQKYIYILIDLEETNTAVYICSLKPSSTGKFKYVFDDRKIRVLIRVSKQLRVLIRVLIRVIKIIKKLRV